MADSPFGRFCAWAIASAPVYVTCPWCSHPTLIPRDAIGTHRTCRQCYGFYFVKDPTSMPAQAEVCLPGPHLVPNPSSSLSADQADAAICRAVHGQRLMRSALAG